MRKQLTPEQRLEILRNGDGERKWHSLDDRRVCMVCDRIITGRQIKIRRDQRGRYLLACPTQGCPSFVGHWFYVGRAAGPASSVFHHGPDGHGEKETSGSLSSNSAAA